uniref:TPT domain-containing protein n=1 Tax=Steinernema glaseri TaxID=37863 RepID=A0A1I7Z8Z9_9BILA
MSRVAESTPVSSSISRDAFYFWLLNVSSSFMISAAHNTLYFVLDLRTPVFHFLHHATTFGFLVLTALAGHFPQSLPKPNVLAIPVALQCVVTLLTAIVHSSNRIGSLYLLRLTDVFSTLAVLKWLPVASDKFPHWGLMIPLSIGASLSWLELGNLEYDTVGLLLAPILGLLRGLQLIVMQKAYRESGASSCAQFSTYFCAAVSAALLLPAAVSYSMTEVKADASWESIDYTLIGLSFFFMIGYKYSELFLTLSLDARLVLAAEQTKFFAASIGQWFLQNMAHATIFSFCGKLIFGSSLLRLASHYPFGSSAEARRKTVKQ